MHHLIEETPVKFQSHESLPNIGLMVLLPFLIETGLLSYRSHFEELRKGYYYIDFIIMLLSFIIHFHGKNIIGNSARMIAG